MRLVQCKLIMNDDRNLGQLHFASLWDFPSSWTMIGFPFSASPSMSCNSVAESSVSTVVLVIDMNHTCLRIRSWTDLASYPSWLGLLCWSCHFQAVWSNICTVIDSLTSLLFIFSNRLVLIFQVLITCLDDLIIILVGFQSLNTNTKNIYIENHHLN